MEKKQVLPLARIPFLGYNEKNSGRCACLMDYFTHIPSPLGELTAGSDGEQLIGLWLPDQKYHRATLSRDALSRDDLPVFRQTRQWLAEYFSGQEPSLARLPLAPRGSPFRQEVWRILCGIPYGETVTYSEIARKMGKPGASQAVGGAVGHNPISILIPCHRVVGTNGSLTGYAGGIAAKQWLLQHEQK